MARKGIRAGGIEDFKGPTDDWEAALSGYEGGKEALLKSLLEEGSNYVDFDAAEDELFGDKEEVFDDELPNGDAYIAALRKTGSPYMNQDFAMSAEERGSDAVMDMIRAIEGGDVDEDYEFDPDSEGATSEVMNYIAGMLGPQSTDLGKVKGSSYFRRLVPHVLSREREYLDDLEDYMNADDDMELSDEKEKNKEALVSDDAGSGEQSGSGEGAGSGSGEGC